MEADGYRVARVLLGTHTGTHLDAPTHFLAGGETVDRMDLARALASREVKVVSEKVSGDSATLEVTGKMPNPFSGEVEEATGTVQMIREKGEWVLVQESWKS